MDRYRENELHGQIWLSIQAKQAFDSIKTEKIYCYNFIRPDGNAELSL